MTSWNTALWVRDYEVMEITNHFGEVFGVWEKGLCIVLRESTRFSRGIADRKTWLGFEVHWIFSFTREINFPSTEQCSQFGLACTASSNKALVSGLKP